MKKVLAISGGGMKGFYLPGVIYPLKIWGLLDDLHTIACTSIGSFVGGLLCLKYEAEGERSFSHILFSH